MAGLNLRQRRELAERLRRIAEEKRPAMEWPAIAEDYRRQADALAPPQPQAIAVLSRLAGTANG